MEEKEKQSKKEKDISSVFLGFYILRFSLQVYLLTTPLCLLHFQLYYATLVALSATLESHHTYERI